MTRNECTAQERNKIEELKEKEKIKRGGFNKKYLARM